VPPVLQVPPFGMHIGVVVVVGVPEVGQAGAQAANPGGAARQTSRRGSQTSSQVPGTNSIRHPVGQPIQIVVVPSAATAQLQFAGQGGEHIGGAGAHSPPNRSCTHTSLQHSSSAVQDSPPGRHIRVVEVVLVDVEVVLVDVEVVGVVVEVLVEVLVVLLVDVLVDVEVVGVVSHRPRRSPWSRWLSTALWETSLVFSAGVPGLWQIVTFCC
jgi:hypothetical protein